MTDYTYIKIGYLGGWKKEGAKYMARMEVALKVDELIRILNELPEEQEYLKLRGNMFDNSESKQSENSPDYRSTLDYPKPTTQDDIPF